MKGKRDHSGNAAIHPSPFHRKEGGCPKVSGCRRADRAGSWVTGLLSLYYWKSLRKSRMVLEEGVARRRSGDPAFALGAGRRASAPRKVALFLPDRSAPAARSPPSRCAPRNGKGRGAGGGGRTPTPLPPREFESDRQRN